MVPLLQMSIITFAESLYLVITQLTSSGTALYTEFVLLYLLGSGTN